MFELFKKEERIVLSLTEVARKLKDTFGWRSCMACAAAGTIVYVSQRGRMYSLDLDGGAHEFFRGEPLPRTDPDESMCIRDVLGLKDLQWKRDGAGNVVAVC